MTQNIKAAFPAIVQDQPFIYIIQANTACGDILQKISSQVLQFYAVHTNAIINYGNPKPAIPGKNPNLDIPIP